MKTSVIFAALSILALSVMVAFARFDFFNHNTSITVNEDEDTYSFTASYDSKNTGMVQRYINSCISPNKLGESENDYVDVSTSLPDKTFFYVKESPGRLKIQLNKRKNSSASCYRIKTMCEGIKDRLGGK